jgi:glutamate-5-semialdehyde dehydrogenase
MTAPLKTIEGSSEIAATMSDIGRRAKAAARVLALAATAQKDRALAGMASAICASKSEILAANAEDLADGKTAGLTAAMIERLTLNDQRVEAMAEGLDVVRGLADPVGRVTESWTRPNGMTIERVKVPLGVVGVIYESRPNVTADAGGLTLKAGNAVILRGGSDSHRSSRAIHAALTKGLREANLPEAAISLVPTRDRAAVGMMLQGLDGNIDVIVPRGGKPRGACRARRGCRCSRISKASATSTSTKRRPRHGQDHRDERKLRRTGVCGAAEPCWSIAPGGTHLRTVIAMLLDAGCEVRGDAAAERSTPREPASEADWSTEYLDKIITAGVVDGVDAAIEHIERYGTHHTDAIVTADKAAAEKFLNEVDPRSCCTTPRRSSPMAASSAWRRDRHRHRQAARPRPGRRRAAHQLQVSRARHRADQAVTIARTPFGA